MQQFDNCNRILWLYMIVKVESQVIVHIVDTFAVGA